MLQKKGYLKFNLVFNLNLRNSESPGRLKVIWQIAKIIQKCINILKIIIATICSRSGNLDLDQTIIVMDRVAKKNIVPLQTNV